MTSTAPISEKERLYHFYVTCNMSKEETCKVMGYYCVRGDINKISIGLLDKKLKNFHIIRPIYLMVFNTKRSCYIKYGTDNINTLKEIKDKIKQTNLKRYGVEHILKTKAGMDKLRETNLKRYGTEYVAKVEKFKEKIKETNLEKYGTENVFASDYAKEKMKQTCTERYGVEHYTQTSEYKQRAIKTNLEKYGTEYYTQTEEYLEKTKETCLKKYGTNWAGESKEIRERIKQTNLNRYGYENTFQVEKYKEKAKETCIKRYGTKYYTQTKEYQERAKKTNLEKYGVECVLQSEEIKQKSKQTNLKRYGVDNAMKLQITRNKVYNTKKLRGKLTTSSQEEKINEMLLKKFHDIKRQYKSKLYPFACDFYIPVLDLYIEYQGHWSHGKKLGPYNKDNIKHQNILNTWKEKAINSQQYKDAIDVWMRRDPLKRKTAKDNGLNWLEFFTLEDFMNWYKTI